MTLPKYLAVLVLAVVVSGCSSMREINLSGYKTPTTANVSYFLVDKNPDYQTEAIIFLVGIDDNELNLINDPGVYLIKHGNHTLLFEARDFHGGHSSDTKHRLEVTSQPGKYYQVLPVRKNGILKFVFAEINPEKVTEIHRREIKSMVGYLFSDG